MNISNLAIRRANLALFLLALLLPGCGAADQDEPVAAQVETPATDAYASVLEKYVDGRGMVDYKTLAANREPLDRYVKSLAALDAAAYEKWSHERRIAFWINAYNALTLETIIDHYPIKGGGWIREMRFPSNSIRQIDGVWDKLEHPVMGKKMTLDHIEHEILRKQFNAPRIHVALVCAAMGCPPLRREPYAGDRLSTQLDDQAKQFFANPKKFRIDRDEKKVYLSSIFKWFGADFAGKYATQQFQEAPKDVRPVLEFASRYVSSDDAQFLKSGKFDVEYLDYDWSLNEQ